MVRDENFPGPEINFSEDELELLNFTEQYLSDSEFNGNYFFVRFASEEQQSEEVTNQPQESTL